MCARADGALFEEGLENWNCGTRAKNVERSAVAKSRVRASQILISTELGCPITGRLCSRAVKIYPTTKKRHMDFLKAAVWPATPCEHQGTT